MIEPMRREVRAEEQQWRFEEVLKRQKLMAEAVDVVAKTNAGLELLRFLFKESGFATRGPVLSGPNQISLEGTLWNVARRDVYMDIRQFMTPEVIKSVELDPITEESKHAGIQSKFKSEPKS